MILASPLDRLVNAGATVQVATAMSLVDEQRELFAGAARGWGAGGVSAGWFAGGGAAARGDSDGASVVSAQAALLVQKHWPTAQTVVSMGAECARRVCRWARCWTGRRGCSRGDDRDHGERQLRRADGAAGRGAGR